MKIQIKLVVVFGLQAVSMLCGCAPADKGNSSDAAPALHMHSQNSGESLRVWLKSPEQIEQDTHFAALNMVLVSKTLTECGNDFRIGGFRKSTICHYASQLHKVRLIYADCSAGSNVCVGFSVESKAVEKSISILFPICSLVEFAPDLTAVFTDQPAFVLRTSEDLQLASFDQGNVISTIQFEKGKAFKWSQNLRY